MKKALYLRLACTNLWKNRQTYLPFILAGLMLVFTFYSLTMITMDEGLKRMDGGYTFMSFLSIGTIIVALFTLIFLFYANSFLIKRRKKELGLYAILGMEKRHIARILCYEMLLCLFICLLFGLLLGGLLGRLLFMLVRAAVRYDIPLSGAFSQTAAFTTTILFCVSFLSLILYNTIAVSTVSPISLLQGGQVGEKQPKSHWILTVIGFAAMGGGYYLAQSVKNPVAAIALFFIAVTLVIVGTYCLFIAGSVTVLKALKNNKRLYYRQQNFISISGMLYRMKQNAAGLASICILCTMAMVTIGTTSALYNSTEKMFGQYYPNDLQMAYLRAEDLERDLVMIHRVAKEHNVEIVEEKRYVCQEADGYLVGNEMRNVPKTESIQAINFEKMYTLLLFDNTEYNRLTGASTQLQAGEALIGGVDTMSGEMQLGGKAYQVRAAADTNLNPGLAFGSSILRLIVILPDEDAVEEAFRFYHTQNEVVYRNAAYINFKGNVADCEKAAEEIRSLHRNDDCYHTNKYNLRQEWYMMYGGFYFVGMFLGLIFLMATAMIIYFKQISEGYQDHDRFVILQKVGLGNREVRATIRRQVLAVFALPLIMAICHVAGSLNMIIKMMILFGLTDVPYIAQNSFLTSFLIAALYGLCYLWTAKAYYRLVKFS